MPMEMEKAVWAAGTASGVIRGQTVWRKEGRGGSPRREGARPCAGSSTGHREAGCSEAGGCASGRTAGPSTGPFTDTRELMSERRSRPPTQEQRRESHEVEVMSGIC